MMIKQPNKLLILLFLFISFSCEKEMEKYYERPDFLKGSAYELMKQRGNFSIFLRAAEKVGYSSMLKGRGLCTVIAPTDDAFETYFAEQGYTSLDDVPLDVLNVLVPYHLLENSYEKEYLLGFTRDPEYYGRGNGSAYKFKTYAREQNNTEVDPITGDEFRIYHHIKYLPIISSRLFMTNKCSDAEGNYKFFFPSVNWQGSNETLHVGNAAFLETGIPTDNGYLNVIDKVVEPFPTLYDVLRTNSVEDYSAFKYMYDQFAEFTKVQDSLYYYEHLRRGGKARALSLVEQLPCLASEWAYHGELDGARPYIDLYMDKTYNCFAPTTRAVEDFFDSYFEGYDSYKDLPQLTLFYLLGPHVRECQTILLPETVYTMGINGYFGEKWQLSRNEILTPKFCANGLFYGMNQVFKPLLFDIITKPLFQTPNFSVVANMFFKGDQFVTLADPTEDKYTLLIQHDTTLLNQYNYSLNYGSSHFNDTGEKINESGNEMTVAQINNINELHIIYGAIKDLSKRWFYSAKKSFSYVYTDNGKLYSETGEELMIDKSWQTLNGVTYQIGRQITQSSTLLIDLLLSVSEYSDYVALLKQAEILKQNKSTKKWEFTNISGDRCMVFAPVNNSFDNNALKALNKVELTNLLNYTFISVNANVLSEYILPNYGTNNSVLKTLSKSTKSTSTKIIYNEMTLQWSGNKLLLMNSVGDRNLTDENIPLFAVDGLLYGTSGLLIPNE